MMRRSIALIDRRAAPTSAKQQRRKDPYQLPVTR
jgi:hypothetical protein